MKPLRVAIVGAGPAGLYLAYRLKRSPLDVEIDLYEQNPQAATFGFGVAFSARALEFLSEGDPETYAALLPRLESWDDSVIVHRGHEVRIDGIGYNGIGRLKLLEFLRGRARAVGIVPRYEHVVENVTALANADLIVGADGVNSIVRRDREDLFGTKIAHFACRFAWFGTARRYEALTHTFVETALGHFNAHHHRHAPNASTFVVEMDEKTFLRAGFDTMTPEATRATCERVFAATLDGHKLISNKSIWRQFPRIANERWSAGKHVLIGDAAHTAHFSIGSGTRLAMEDAIALASALEAQPDDPRSALAAYEAARKPIVTKLVAAADASAAWYDLFPSHMALPPMDFAMSYITRSGRVNM
jgi:2-polyprenyl-6-methoxyphenol hydroxylase-like FAD-dependent oxidoreductase